MTAGERSGSAHGLRWWLSESPDEVFRYLPEAPSIRSDPAVGPEARLLEAAGTGILALGVEFAPPPGAVEALRGWLADRFDRDPEELRLQPGPARVREARLGVVEDGEFRSLVRSSTSGVPPWIAALGGAFYGPDREALKEAFEGTRGRVQVRLAGTLETEVTVEARLTGDASGLLADPSCDDGTIEREIASGALSLTLAAPPDAPDGLVLQVKRELHEGAARALEHLRSHPRGAEESADLEVEVHRTATLDKTFDRVADLADLLEASGALQPRGAPPETGSRDG